MSQSSQSAIDELLDLSHLPEADPEDFRPQSSRLIVTSLDALSERHGIDAQLGELMLTSLESVEGNRPRISDLAMGLHLSPATWGPRTSSTFNVHALRSGQRFTADNGTRYRVVHELGRGGMGVVIQAQRLGHVPCDVAIKFLFAEQKIESLVQEYSAARLLNGHLNIADIHVLDSVEGVPFGEFEFIRGETLYQIEFRHCLHDRGWCVPQQLVAWTAWQACEALIVAHNLNAGGRRTGILHKDIKPSNIMIDHNGVVKILDFGLAQDIVHVRSEVKAGRVTGTPVIIPSELLMTPRTFAQIIGERFGAVDGEPEALIDGRADIFSLACAMYYILTGFFPSDPDDDVHSYSNPLFAIHAMHMRPLNPPHALIKNISPVLSKIVYLGMHPDPRHRPDARTFHRLIGGFLYPEGLGQGLFLSHVRDYLGLLGDNNADPTTDEARALKAVFEKAPNVIQAQPQSYPYLGELERRYQSARAAWVPSRHSALQRPIRRGSGWMRRAIHALTSRTLRQPRLHDTFEPRQPTDLYYEADRRRLNPARFQLRRA